MLRAKKTQKYTFSEETAGRDMAVAAAAAMNALGLSRMIPGMLPKRWSRGWNKKRFVPFTKWPTQGEFYGITYAPRLLDHFVGALTVFDVPFGVEEFDFKDVHTHKTKLSFAGTTGASNSFVHRRHRCCCSPTWSNSMAG